MKRIITLFALAFAAFSAAQAGNAVTTQAADSRVTYVGRTQVAEGAVSFDWSGVTARLRFEGASLAVKCSDTKKNYYNVWIDRERTTAEADKVIALCGTDTVITIASRADFLERAKGMGKAEAKRYLAAPHSVIIQKRTEGEQGTTTLKEWITEGALLQAEGLKARMIEFVGDSYTCGFGSENSVAADPFTPETENTNKSYCNIIARHFDADAFIIAHSGMGITRNYNTKFAGWYMPDRYLQTFDMDKDSRWDAAASGFKPAITVIYLGANDFSVSLQPSYATFAKRYTTLLSEIKAAYGEDHPVLCVAPKNDFKIFEYVHQVVEACGMKNVRSLGILEGVQYNDDRELGACSHPNYKAHQKIASAIMPYVATMAGWEFEVE